MADEKEKKVFSPSKIPLSNVGKISESCLDYLNIEMVEYVVSTSKDSREDTFLKLERIGFLVGQKLVQRFVIVSFF